MEARHVTIDERLAPVFRRFVILAAALSLVAGLTTATAVGKQIKPKVGSKWSGKFKSSEVSFESAKISFKIVKKHGKRYAKGKIVLHTGCFVGDSQTETPGPKRTYSFKARIKSGSFKWTKKATAGTGEVIEGFFTSKKRGTVNIQADDDGCGFEETVGGKIKRK
jgi:hypothetical protein